MTSKLPKIPDFRELTAAAGALDWGGMTVKIPLDNELHAAIIRDAGRHLRPADLHVVYLLRQALHLEFPLPDIKNPARCARPAGRGTSTNPERVNDDARL
jgi:hypothetical protein